MLFSASRRVPVCLVPGLPCYWAARRSRVRRLRGCQTIRQHSCARGLRLGARRRRRSQRILRLLRVARTQVQASPRCIGKIHTIYDCSGAESANQCAQIAGQARRRLTSRSSGPAHYHRGRAAGALLILRRPRAVGRCGRPLNASVRTHEAATP